MRLFAVTLVGLIAALYVSQAGAEIFGGIDFPQGAVSFVDLVVSYEPLHGGGPGPYNPNFMAPDESLGPPNYTGGSNGLGAVSLGHGGRITLRFTDNHLTGSGDDSPDLHIFEVGPQVEDTFVEISKDGITWHDVGEVTGGTSSIDIDAFGFGIPDLFAFVRLSDDPTEGSSGGDTVGGDIDAVGAITSVIHEPSIDFDGDGNVNLVDVNLLTAEANLPVGLAVPPADAKFDLTDDDIVDTADLDQWLTDAATINGLDSPYLRGDANLDGDVDVWDFDGSGDAQILSSNMGMASGAQWGDGDFNGDGDVDVWDFDGSGDAQVLSENMGSTHDVGATVVPEPSTIVLLVMGAIGLLAYGWRRRRAA